MKKTNGKRIILKNKKKNRTNSKQITKLIIN